MKTAKTLILVLLLAVLVLTAVLSVYEYHTMPSDWSVYENRALAQPPQMTAEAVLSGDAMAQTEAFLSDHIFSRDRRLRLSTRMDLLLKKPVIHDVVVTEDVLLPVLTQTAQESIVNTDGLQAVKAAVDAYGGTLLYVQIPEQRTALRSAYPKAMQPLTEQYDEAARALREALEQAGIPVFDASQVLTSEDYHTTDHHYNLRGADKVYKAVCARLRQMGVAVYAEDTVLRELPNPFWGAYSRKFYGLSTVEDKLLVCDTDVPYIRYDNGERTDAPMVIVPQADTEPVFYNNYMGGDMAQTIVQTSRESLPDVLIVGDSFTNAFEAVAYRSFDEMRSLDFRHYTEKTLTEYLQDYQPDVVLIMRDDISAMLTSGNGDLR